MQLPHLVFSFISILLLTQPTVAVVSNYCAFSPDFLEDCADGQTNFAAVALCIAKRTTVSALIECIGFQNSVGCTEKPRFWELWKDVGALDRDGDERFCARPREVLFQAVVAAKCGSLKPGLLVALSQCPDDGNDAEYKNCLCSQGFDGGDLDILDICLGTLRRTDTCFIDFDYAGCGRVKNPRVPEPVAGCPLRNKRTVKGLSRSIRGM